MAYADKNDYLRAEEMYKRAISLDPSNPVAYHNLANTYRAMGKIDLAIENYHKAISLNPEFVFSLNSLVSLYLENKNYQKAREVLENYLHQSGPKIDIFFLLSQIALEEGDLKGALSYLEKALVIDPKNQLIQNSIINLKNFIESKK